MRAPESPATSSASRLWQAVTPEPQYITTSLGSRPCSTSSHWARSSSGDLKVLSAVRFCWKK